SETLPLGRQGQGAVQVQPLVLAVTPNESQPDGARMRAVINRTRILHRQNHSMSPHSFQSGLSVTLQQCFTVNSLIGEKSIGGLGRSPIPARLRNGATRLRKKFASQLSRALLQSPVLQIELLKFLSHPSQISCRMLLHPPKQYNLFPSYQYII